MKKTRLAFKDIYPAGPTYIRGIRAGDTLYISGCTARNSKADGGPPMEQLKLTLDRIIAMVKAEGGKPADIVKMTLYTTKMEAFWPIAGEQVTIWHERFGDDYPTNAYVEVSKLAEPSLCVELDAIAVLD